MRNIVAVGSEPNTLVAALLLGRAGHPVQLLSGPTFGGIASLLGNAPLDSRLAEELAIELPLPREGRLGVSPSGARVSLRRSEIQGEVSQRDQQRWPLFVKLLDDASSLWRLLQLQPVEDLVGQWRELGRRQAMEVLRLPWHNLRDFLNEWFDSDLLKATLAAAALKGTRQGPFASGTAFLLIARWARNEVLASAPPPFDALSAALQQAGVVVQKESAARFEVADGKVIAVHSLAGRLFEADVVVSGEDPLTTFHHRLRLSDADPETVDLLESWQTRSTTGTAEAEADGYSDHGVVSFTDTVASLERAYDPSKYGRSAEAPFAELETAQQRVWVQHLVGDDAGARMDQVAKTYGFTALDKLGPSELEYEFGVTGGHLYGGDPVLWQSHGLRDGFSRPLQNLVLCGPSTGTGDYSGLNGERCARGVLGEAG